MAFEEVFFTGLLLLFIVFIVPVVIAFARRHPNRWAIFIVTVVFGGTLLGWLVALVWSLHAFHRGRDPRSRGGASGLNLFADDVRRVEIVGPAAGGRTREEPASVRSTASTSSGHTSRVAARELVAVSQEPAARGTVPARTIAFAEPRISLAEAADQIERLAALRDGGHLTVDEYARLKAAVLARVQR